MSSPCARGWRLQLVGVVDVQRPAAIDHDVVGDIDDGVDRPLADGLEARLHPGGRRAVLDALDVAAGEAGAGVLAARRELEQDVDGAVERAFDAVELLFGLQRAEARGREIARDAAHARAVRPVRRQLDLDDGIAESRARRHSAGRRCSASLASRSTMPS